MEMPKLFDYEMATCSVPRFFKIETKTNNNYIGRMASSS